MPDEAGEPGPRLLVPELRSCVLCILALCAPTIAANAETQQVRVEVAGGGAPESVRIESRAGEARQAIEVPLVAGAGVGELELGGGGPWVLSADAAGYWAEEIELRAGQGPELPVLRLWPASMARGVVSWPRNVVGPERVRLTVDPMPEPGERRGQPRRASVECPVAQGGALRCALPSGQWHLRIDAAGFAPVFRWGLGFRAGEGIDLGNVLLRPGASLLGRVVDEGGLALGGARVVLSPLVAGRPERAGPPPAEALRNVAVDSNPWGYFHFDGLAPGSYSLRASSEGLLPAGSSQIDLGESQAVELAQPLVLARPLRLGVEIALTGATSAMRLVVQIVAETEQGRLEPVARSEAVDGSWLSPPLAPGLYSVQVLDPRGASLAWEEIDLRADQVLELELALVLVTGEVRLGEEPISATLFFGGIGGGTRVPVEADEGRFSTVLPRGGEWTVDVLAVDPPIHARDVAVEVAPDRRTHEAEVEIVLPDTLVSGVVVDAEERPVAGADIRLTTPSGRGFSRTKSRPDGGFELRGQAPGTYALQAELEGETSEVVHLVLAEEHPRRDLRLVLGRSVVLRGRVSGPLGGIGSAFLLALPFDAAGSMAGATFLDATANLEGEFEIRFPPATARADLYVLAPGHLFQVERVAVGEAEPVVLSLAQSAGGSLRLPSSAPAGKQRII